MKFSELARFTPERQNGEVTTSRPPFIVRPKVAELIIAVNARPGSSYKEIGRALGAITDIDFRNVASRLASTAKAETGQIKRVKQDGIYRYYPNNYLPFDNQPAAPKNYVCKYCGQEFPKPMGLAGHIRWHHQDEKITQAPKLKPVATNTLTIDSLAKNFYWETGSKDLTEFISYLKERGIE